MVLLMFSAFMLDIAVLVVHQIYQDFFIPRQQLEIQLS